MPEPLTFDLVVEQPYADTNAYAFDAHTGGVRLERVVRVSAPAFADRAVVANAVTPRGEPLRAWLLCDLPHSPQAHVAARAVGALEYQRGELVEQMIVAVPRGDPRYDRAREFNTLPGPHRAALQRILEESARWLDADSAEELVHLARQRARLAQSHAREREGQRPAWEMGSEYNHLAHLARETTLHTQAEAALFTVPYRFQMYLRLCLTRTERILYWVHRPLMKIGGFAGVGGKVARGGLLVITDQQCLWMVDPVTATVSVEGGYGYIARALPVEWMVDAAVSERADYLLLQMTSTNPRNERKVFALEFAASAREDLVQVTRLLCGFTPRSEERRLRRAASPQVVELRLDDPMESDRAKTSEAVAALRAIQAPQLNGATVYAQAFVPTWAEGGAKLLTVTDRVVLLTAQQTRSNGNPRVFDLRAMIAPEICFSVLGSWLRLLFAEGRPLEIAFPPTAFKGFNTCWLLLRQLSAVTPRAGLPVSEMPGSESVNMREE